VGDACSACADLGHHAIDLHAEGRERPLELVVVALLLLLQLRQLLSDQQDEEQDGDQQDEEQDGNPTVHSLRQNELEPQ